jgi:hypothetical protein
LGSIFGGVSMDYQYVIDWISHHMYLQIEKDIDILDNRADWDKTDSEIVDEHFEVRDKFVELITKAYPDIGLEHEDFRNLKAEWEKIKEG